jgi:aspartyl/asparaginyl-tRNA synthetase
VRPRFDTRGHGRYSARSSVAGRGLFEPFVGLIGTGGPGLKSQLGANRVSQPVYIENLRDHAGGEVTVRGWLYNSRHSGKLYFLLLRDGTGVVQGVVSRKDVDEATWSACEGATQESALLLTGTVREDARAPGGYELTVREVRLHSGATDYPITPKEHGTDFLMDHRHLWLRSSRQHAILRVRHEIVSGIRDFLNARGFTLVDAPSRRTPARGRRTSSKPSTSTSRRT